MGCGWCGDGCRRRHECPGHWVQDSCPPVLTDVGLRCVPLLLTAPSTQMGRDVANGVACGRTPSLGWLLCSSEKGILGLSAVTALWGDTGASPTVPSPERPAAGSDTGDTLWNDLPHPLGPRRRPQPPRCLPGGSGTATLHRAARGERERQVCGGAGREQQQGGLWGCPRPGADPCHCPADPCPPRAARSLWMCWCVSWSRGARQP